MLCRYIPSSHTGSLALLVLRGVFNPLIPTDLHIRKKKSHTETRNNWARVCFKSRLIVQPIWLVIVDVDVVVVVAANKTNVKRARRKKMVPQKITVWPDG